MFKVRLFDKSLDRATSHLLMEPDLEAMLTTCDEIRQKELTCKSALSALKRKLQDENHNVVYHSLTVLECWMKNCGPPMHAEVGTRDFMDFLRDILGGLSEKPRNKLLELIQCWAFAFKDKHRSINDVYNLLRSENYDFPEFVEADAHFDAEVAPEWKDSNSCCNCRTEFSLIKRKHHCRNCGEIFCGDCTRKQCVIPKYGYEREVRVCDACFDELSKKSGGGGGVGGKSSSSSSRNNSTDTASQAERQRKERELQLQEEEELQLAMAISQSEFESQNTKKKSSNTVRQVRPASPPVQQQQQQQSVAGSEVSSELDRYLDRAYWEKRQQQQSQTQTPVAAVATAPTAPSPTDSIAATMAGAAKVGAVTNGAPQVKQEEAEQFVRVVQTQIAAFLSRLKFDQQRGRDVTSDAAVQTQFVQLSRAHEVLLGFMRETDDRRNFYEGLQDKLVQLSDAREALDALRVEQVERRRLQAEEEERQRRVQMASKLDYMRARKHEYLEMQRRQALARLEEQQRDMAMRLEQQKVIRLTAQSAQPGAYYAPPGQPGVPTGYYGAQPGAFVAPQGFPTWNGEQWVPQAAPVASTQSNGNMAPQVPTGHPAPQQGQVPSGAQQPPQQYIQQGVIPNANLNQQQQQPPPQQHGAFYLPPQQQQFGVHPAPAQTHPPPPQQQQQPPPPVAAPAPQPAVAELISFD